MVLGLSTNELWFFPRAVLYWGGQPVFELFSRENTLPASHYLRVLPLIQRNGLLNVKCSGISVYAQEFLEFYVFKQLSSDILMRVMFLGALPRVSRELA